MEERNTSEQASLTGRVVAAAVFIWILVVTMATQLVGLIRWQAAQLEGTALSGLERVLPSLLYGILLLLPLTPLARRWSDPSRRALFRSWALAAAFVLFLAPVNLPNPQMANAASALQIVLALTYALVIRRLRPPSSAGAARRADGALLLGMIAPAFVLLPWLQRGALGTPLELGLNLAAASSFGLAATAVVSSRWPTPVGGPVAAQRRGLFPDGLVVGAGLLIMGSGFGFSGTGLILGLVLPSIAWALVVVDRHSPRWLPSALLIALSALGPLLLIDPRELAVIISFQLFGLLAAVAVATGLSVLGGWLASVLFLAGNAVTRARRGNVARSRPLLAIGAILLWALAAGIYLLFGHPGFYGDQLFVVMQQQADLSAAANESDPTQRRALVFRTLVEHATSTQEGIRRDLDRFGIDYTPYYLVNGLAVDGGPFLRAWLENSAMVDRVLYNPRLRPAPSEPILQASEQAPHATPENLVLIGADRVWQELGITGTGILIGQSDSGVQWTHPELRDGYRGRDGEHDYNWLDPWNGTAEPVDPAGHGTHTLGTTLGNTTGVAPGADWIACANLARNLGSPSLYLDCLQFMLAPYPRQGDAFRDGDPLRGAQVLNNSWGCPPEEGCDPGVLEPAVAALRAAGLFVVVAAGNGGPACGTVTDPPAIYDQVLSVGAESLSGTIAPFSSRGPVRVDGSDRPKPDLVAPGVSILSAYPTDGYLRADGTSSAAPHVSGTVALMWSANPALAGDIAATERILVETARPDVRADVTCGAPAALPNNVSGYGMVDAYAAVQRALTLGAQ